MSAGALLRQLMRTVAVQVAVATGSIAIVVGVAHLVEGAGNGGDLNGQIVAIDQRDVVVVHAAVAVKGELGQRDRRSAACSVALDFVACKKRK